MATAIVLYGPKAVGKSWVAEVLRTHLGVAHVDADELVGDLLAAGTRPESRRRLAGLGATAGCRCP
jgi:dephospho-CoA kinase